MLMSTQTSRYAFELLDARAAGRTLSPLSSREPLSNHDAYAIAHNISEIRTAQGEAMVGRKIGFTNRKIWSKYGASEPIHGPIWTPLFDGTVRYADDNRGLQSLEGAIQPRIGPEVVFCLGRTPEPDATLEQISDCIEWMAHAFEIVVCPFPEWKFEEADAIAAFAMHGTLILGEPRMLSAGSRRNLADVLANASLSLSCDGVLYSAGFGTDVLDSPVHALLHLHRQLQEQKLFSPLQAGEIITTGTWADVLPIAPGQTWSTAFSGVSLPGLTISLV